jgi:lysophospholipase L1-like esterase
VTAADLRAFSVLGWLAALLGVADGTAAWLRLKYIQEVEWPTDLFTLQHMDRAGARLGIVGSSRAHADLPPSGLAACGPAVAANRLTASLYTVDIVARDLFTGRDRPDTLVVEVSPEALAVRHFELDYNVASVADPVDVPECVAAALTGPPRLASCARPLVRGVENAAFLLHRPWADVAHIRWMALYFGGGQYCYGDPECEARNRAYDQSHARRWTRRVQDVLPRVRSERFAAYAIEGGLPARHLSALLARSMEQGTRVVLVNLPVADVYQAEIPAEAYRMFLTFLEHNAGGARVLDFNTPAWRSRRDWFLDPDHLNAEGARALTAALCDALGEGT